MKARWIPLLLLTLPLVAFGQFSFKKGRSVFELSANFITYYNQRFYPDGTDDLKKNRFRLRDAQLNLEGRINGQFEVKLDIDFASVADLNQANNPTSNPLVNDAYIQYNAPFSTEIRVGFQKVPYSRNSMVPIIYQPFLTRPTLSDGDLFNRRDVGITWRSTLWNQRINLYAGIYNGTGQILRDNDASGNLEYVSRLDVSWPSRFRYREVDTKHIPIPQFQVGLNGRFSDQQIANDLDYPLFIEGQKLFYGLDAAFQYQGFSAQFEIHQGRYTPNDTNSALLFGQETDYFRAGGWMLSANYHIDRLNTVLAVQYVDLNPQDLVLGDDENTISYALVWLADGWNTAIKIQFMQRLQSELTGQPWKPHDLRLGFQYLFR